MADPGAQRPDVLIIGGGWAGLSAAVELAHQGRKVQLFEAARQLGGRARCVRFGDDRVDNGQHIMVGAYHGMLNLLDTLGIASEQCFLRLPLDLHIHSLHRRSVRLQARRLPAPLHLASAVLMASGLSPRQRLRLARFSLRLLRGHIRIEQDITAQALLMAEGQDARLIQALWGPLCLAALNTAVTEASAKLFVEVLQRTFSGDKRNADLLIPRIDLGALLPEPAADYIEQHGGSLVLNRRVQGLTFDATRCTGARWKEGSIEAEHVLVAVNPSTCRRLLASHPALKSLNRHLGQLRQDPITTVYLRYPEQVRLGATLCGLQDGLGQWFFDRATTNQPGLIAAVISGCGAHEDLDTDTLAAQVSAELAGLHPDWPAPLAHLVIREKRATFAATPESTALRPTNQTPVAGLWLAGDFTATGLPATLEGAVISGRRAAQAILAS